MGKPIPSIKVRLIEKLSKQKVSAGEIARRTDVSYSTAYAHTIVKQRGFRSNTEYGLYLTNRNGFSNKEYREFLARRKINPETGKLFASRSEYDRYLLKQRGYLSLTDYHKKRREEKESLITSVVMKRKVRSEYDKRLAKRKGFASHNEYRKCLDEQRMVSPVYQRFSDLVIQRLSELGKNQAWLARQIGVREGAISRYSNRKDLPGKVLQEKLFGALGLPYETLEDLAEEIN